MLIITQLLFILLTKLRFPTRIGFANAWNIFQLLFILLIKLRFPTSIGFVDVLKQRYGPASLLLYRNLEKLDLKVKKIHLDLKFLQTCKRHGILPRFLFFKTYNHNVTFTPFYKSFQFKLLNFEIQQKLKQAKLNKSKLDVAYNDFKSKVSRFDFIILYYRLCQSNDSNCLKKEKTHSKKLATLGISPEFKVDLSKVVTNLSKRNLSLDERTILAHGPNFALPRHKIDFIEHFFGFERLLHSLKSKPIPNDSKLSWKELSQQISGLAHTSFGEFNEHKHTIPKLPPAHTQALKDLRTDTSITITRPDKGKGAVILDKQEYLAKVENILNDPTKFKPLTEDAFKAVTKAEDKLINFLRTLKKEKVITSNTYTQLFPSGSSPGVMYGLPKTHKKDKGTPVRPILASLGTYNYNLAKFFVPILDPLTRNEYTIKDSFGFVSEVSDIKPGQYVMASFDVESLFTNIPLDETVSLIANALFEKEDDKFKNFSKAQFTKLLNFAVKDSPFFFNNKLYIQTDGMAMGSALGPTFANCFLGFHEKTWLNECPLDFKPLFYRRFVDDTFLLFKDAQHIPQFLSYLNSKHSNIKFTVENETEGKLPFLDILLTRGETGISTSMYRKPTYSGLGINYLSFVPEQFKLNAIKTLLYRCYNICSDWHSIHLELDFLTTFFQNNNFPRFLVLKNIKSFLNKTFSPNPVPTQDKTSIQYIILPYYGFLSFSIRKSLHKLLKQCYPNTIFRYIFTNNRTISTLFKHKESLPSNIIPNIIYQFECPQCNLRYVGQSQRNLFLRTAEHRGLSARTGRPISSPSFSAIRTHSEHMNHPFSISDFKILHKARNSFDLIILESLYIKHLKPELNNYSSLSLFTSN